jgi:cell division septation protein DedD
VAARLARLYLAHGRGGMRAGAFVDAYLAQVPEDAEVAESWAAQAERQGGLREDQQELIARLGRRYPQSPVITRAAGRLYLTLERTDYDALQCYRRLCDDRGMPPEELRTEIARVLGRPTVPAPTVPAPGAVAAEFAPAQADARAIEPAPDEGGPAVSWGESDEPEPRFRMVPRAEAEEEDPEPDLRPTVRRPQVGVAQAGQRAVAAAFRLCRAWGARVRGLVPTAHALWYTVATRHVLGAAAVAMLGALLIWLVATAMDGYFSRPADAPAATAESPAVVPSPGITDDPYTLQVAAYLRQENALKLVDDLKRKGLDAYWNETSSGGKVYYQVRISHFPDQQAARDYGRSLKGKGVIVDFYVTNYVR